MIQHLLAKFQISKMQENQNETHEPDTSPTNPTTTNPTNSDAIKLDHLDTPFKLPMEYLPDEQLCPIDKSVLSDLELIECTKQTNNGTLWNIYKYQRIRRHEIKTRAEIK